MENTGDLFESKITKQVEKLVGGDMTLSIIYRYKNNSFNK